ncbi:MAG: GTP-binding protein [Candidatus Shapirobacteria bacterium]|nr:GTP-binding protein [Candidatus Shapirobacteria bacterium]
MKDLNPKIDFEARIAQIEEEIRTTPYHKGTEHHIGKLKAKIARLKNQEEQALKKSGGHFGFIPKKSGDATVVLIGPPSVGKSTLLNKLTDAHSRVEAWPFTTVRVMPGMMDYQGAKIQIFDLPGILVGAAKGIGRGREVLSATRSAELIILMFDFKTKSQTKSLLKELRQAGVSLPILVVINKVDLRTSDVTSENLVFANAQIIDNPPAGGEGIVISAEKEVGLEELKQEIWHKLGLIRIYLKPKGGEPDLKNPLIMKEKNTVEMVIGKIFPQDKKITQVLLWGPSAHFPSQKVSLSQTLQDGDILSFI